MLSCYLETARAISWNGSEAAAQIKTVLPQAGVCTGTWKLLSHPTPLHPSSNWWWKSSACCRACVCVLEHEHYYPTPPHPTPAVTDGERAVPVAVPVCVQEHERYYPTPPHPSSNWWWKTTACCRACVCTGTWTLLSHPTPPHPSSNWWWKSSACCRACVCTGTWTLLSHPTPPHPSSNWWWKTTASSRACVCTGTWTLLSHPTPPHTTPAVIRMFRNLTAASDRFITSDKSFTAASDAVLLPQVTGKSHCRKWSKLTAASEGWAVNLDNDNDNCWHEQMLEFT